MRLQIRQLVLWPRDIQHKPRVVSFDPGTVNVITGYSKTGKSAVIPIIDYCLGSGRCSIPVRTIRDACAWFGIVVSTSEGMKLLARREPGNQQATGDMFLLEGDEVSIPDLIAEKNTTVDAVKLMLDRLSGLSNLGFDPTGLDGFKGRPSFRDLVAFTFQPQNIVANPDVLFYKADTLEHREKLRTIFPYVLGAMTPELLAKKWEADQVQRELRRKERELDAQSTATERWKAELRTWVSEARDLGLVSPIDAEVATLQTEYIELLRGVVSKTSREAHLTETAIEASGLEGAELDREEADVTLSLSEIRSRMAEMLRLQASVNDYAGAVEKQRDRLALSRWLRELAGNDSRCPICGGAHDDAHRELDALCDALAAVEASARQLGPVPAVFARELISVREEARRLTDRLQAVRIRKNAMEERSVLLSETRWKDASVNRFIGRVEEALKIYSTPDADGSLREEVVQLREELERLRAVLSEAGIRKRTQTALAQVSRFISRILPTLDTERPDDPVELNIDDLTIRVTAPAGRPDSLWEIGSGANWLSYHVATTLALHRLFLGQSTSAIPSFVVYDQPSQVYFPRKLARDSDVLQTPDLTDEDTAAVRKVFAAMGDACETSDGAIQVIVLDHAGSDVWGGLPGVHLVEEWRGGRALVPESWC